MKKITIVALHLNYGGIEKAIATFCNMFCNEYKITIISTYKFSEEPAFNIDKKVDIIYLMPFAPNKAEVIDAIKNIKIISLFKEIIKSLKILYLKRKLMVESIRNNDSDFIISTRIYHNRLVKKYSNKKTIKIAWEHSHHNNKKKYIKSLVNSINGFNYLINVSEELNDFYNKNIITTTPKCIYIPTPLEYFPKKLSNLNSKNFISIGRLSSEKGFLDLIDVFILFYKKNKDYHLTILGDGPERSKIEKKITENGMNAVISLLGYKNTKEIYDLLDDSYLYLMTSYTESFGLVLVEAMSCGVPCIAFDSAKGATEIINHGINGFLVSNRSKEKMVDYIFELTDNVLQRKLLGDQARKKSESYKKESSKKKWETIFSRGII